MVFDTKMLGMLNTIFSGLLTIDPKKRLTMGELCRHPWLNPRKNSNCTKELPTPTLLPNSAGEFGT